MNKSDPDPLYVYELRSSFHQNGYVRPPLEKRLAINTSRSSQQRRRASRRGFEVRLTADTHAELRRLRVVLRRCGFKIGRPFAKANQFRQPIYGRDQVQRFLDLVGERERPPR